MGDPFAFLDPKPELEQLKGNFGCQERGCFERVSIALYDPVKEKAFWTCPLGHECEMDWYFGG